MLLLALICALCAHCKEKGEDCGREVLVWNGALQAGTPSLSYLTPSAAPLSLCPPRGKHRGELRQGGYVRTHRSDPPGLYPFQRWAQMGLEEGSCPSSAQAASFRRSAAEDSEAKAPNFSGSSQAASSSEVFRVPSAACSSW